MANKTKNPENSGPLNQQNQQDQKKGFEQGNGNNNTTAQDSKLKDNARLRDEDMKNRQQSGDQYKVTNQDQKITNVDQPMQNKQDRKMPMDDDADRTTAQQDEPEIDAPQNQPERTERKLPKM